MKWIADRKRDLALLEAHQNLVDTLGDLNAAVLIGQLSIPGAVTLVESAEANTKAALPLALEALEALEAVLEIETAHVGPDQLPYDRDHSEGWNDGLSTVRRVINEKLGGHA